ncbi:DNA adenine methylase [Flavivirga eckloniae]|uniref:Methyltransferase n=1 Tax=Flavivirga eckloniae TaxID=1803846 RepID=A0A2K9PRB9_9FLAO|nr:DNA adenine methylase [Flavivirga eckloniae]AUP79127.1 methyltransferase [Flavivirga eckloniae]
MKSPIILYGGKTSLLNKILPLIPETKGYCEPFFGGGSVYYALADRHYETEVINDVNDSLINFYSVLKNDFQKLKNLVDATLYSRGTYKRAELILKNPVDYSNVQRAWAHWLVIAQSFSGSMSSWSYDVKARKVKTFHNKKTRFIQDISKRMENTLIENRDALEIIKKFDSHEDMFFFIDPPYVGADQGCYKGYTEEDYIKLLDVLNTIKSKFMLTTYDSDLLTEYAKRNNWKQIKIEKPITASCSRGEKRKTKIEVISIDC